MLPETKEALKEDLIRDEGLRHEAYKDSVGLYTIGVGHLLGTEPRMTRLTLPEIYALLDADIDAAEQLAYKYAPILEEDEVRWRAIVNMAFNLGDRLGQFKHFLGAIAKENWTDASTFMMQSLWAKQVGGRAIRLRYMILTGMEKPPV